MKWWQRAGGGGGHRSVAVVNSELKEVVAYHIPERHRRLCVYLYLYRDDSAEWTAGRRRICRSALRRLNAYKPSHKQHPNMLFCRRPPSTKTPICFSLAFCSPQITKHTTDDDVVQIMHGNWLTRRCVGCLRCRPIAYRNPLFSHTFYSHPRLLHSASLYRY